VAQGGFLEVLPELFIPQAGARYKQSTTIRVEDGGTLIQTETIAPGRVASGEVFQYHWLDWRTDLFTGGRLAARERLRMQPGTPQIAALTRHFPCAYYASILAVGPFLLNFVESRSEWNELQTEESWVGASPTADPSAWSFRIVSQTSHALRYTVETVRGLLYRKAGRKLAATRRVAGR
jgi:urease accessory protein